MIKKTFVPTLIAYSFVAFISDVEAATLLIDDFSQVNSEPQQVMNNAAPGTVLTDLDTGLDVNNPIGGSRFLQLESVANIAPGFLGSNITVSESTERLSWSNDVFVQSEALVKWDGNGAGLNADLSGQNGIDLDVFIIDLGATIKWTMIDNNGLEAIALREIDTAQIGTTLSFAFNPNNPDVGDFIIPMGFNFMEVDEVSLMLDSNGVNAIDAQFDRASFSMGMSEIPEPSTVFGLFTVAFLGRCLKRKDKDDGDEK